jgi:hypothetical protein
MAIQEIRIPDNCIRDFETPGKCPFRIMRFELLALGMVYSENWDL